MLHGEPGALATGARAAIPPIANAPGSPLVSHQRKHFMWHSKSAPVVLLLALLGFWQFSHAASTAVDTSDDEKLLKAQGIGTDNAGLLAFLHQKTAREANS